MKKILFAVLCLSSSALAQGPYMSKNLTAEQVSEFRRAVETEGRVVPLVDEYLELRERLQELDARISETWEGAFDSKTYLYNLVMDKVGNAEMLRLYEDKLNAVRAAQAELVEGLRVSAADNYLLQRRLLTEYEISLAEELGKEFLPAAQVDTLRARLARMPKND